jgi:para-aminobenzoate synthetase component I
MKRNALIEEFHTGSTAAQLFELIKDSPYSFFLDSGMDRQRLGRYSFIGSAPFLVMSSRGSEISLLRGQHREVQHGNPFDVLGRLLQVYTLDHCAEPAPFVGGAVGYLGYDLNRFVESVPATTLDDLELPESYFAFYDSAIAFDHLEGRAYLIATGFPELDDEKRLRQARLRLDELRDWLNNNLTVTVAAASHEQSEATDEQSHARIRPSDTTICHNPEHEQITLTANFTPHDYMKAVDRVREYIAAGDVFQVNLTQRFEADLQIPPYEVHKRLRTINPAPFAAYLSFPEVTIVSASPERFLKVQGDMVETRPIKGTRPRGRNPAEDDHLAKELSHSAKDRAENVMIVDLERNDLGRVCRYGTVQVTELAVLETFPTVFHLTSTILGRLLPDKDRIDLLKAAFPGGSITGAPKVRAMEIIDELEPTRRSVYTGSMGYLSFNGNVDINIVIRTILVKQNRAYFQVGGGIIYDSDPEAEYAETLDKARALIQALRLAPGVLIPQE